ncbi:UvrD-helicase domain-containing protein [Leeuwenhoekiella sp. NPDC079379]|uniref:UvrD-helicase domain-containing protein n=1 Tax=Leeuwenhoekiella sp. NPDC079379 TaxID=3364122 RepID=UPI0037CB323A
MQDLPTISIYNASAGAGKTFALVKNYLVILFKSKNEFKYRRILAITFTNKAVAEMKLRIVNNLQAFTHDDIFDNPGPMLLSIEEETGLKRTEIQQKSKRLLKNIVQDFASFDVVTIDNFTHRVIRTFAHDLKIPQNFEVELNTQDVLEQAVDKLIDKAGKDDLVTQVLLDYALEKIDSDRSWDISRDFYEISRLLLSENDRAYLKMLEGKSLKDFADLKEFIKKSSSQLEKGIVEKAKSLLGFIASNGLEEGHFKGKYLPKAVSKISEGVFAVNTTSAWVANLGEEPMYTKTQKQPIKDILDQIAPEIALQFNVIKHDILNLSFQEELYKKITPLSVLQAIQEEVDKIKAENNLILISDFNELINKNIANQPTPFIYERLGERYENYFIDEFQDTSRLQWENLVPLIDNAVSVNQTEDLSNSLMLVGDPKQAIYRWRGGEAAQFIELSNGQNPFQNENKDVINLPFNYRSYDEIITFNNTFFSKLADVFENVDYKKIYTEGNAQRVNTKQGGCVSISFIDAINKEEAVPLYLDEVVTTINSCLANGFTLNELCILVRKNSEGVAIAQRLQEQNIPVISSESLLLKQSSQVQFIVNMLHYTIESESSAISIKLLEYLAEEFLNIKNSHAFYKNNLAYNGSELLKNALGIHSDFDFTQCAILPLYEAVEYIVRSFKLQKNGGAYLQFFLDAIYDFTQKNSGGVPEFITWWNRKQDKLSISTPPASKAVQIMTVHKAKGLEFPVVIYPFADSDLYPRNSDSYNWYLPNADEFLGFKALLIGQKNELTQFNEQTEALYHIKKSLQQLDNINILYVALTRSVEQLHIITNKGALSKAEPKTFSDLFMNFVIQDPDFNEDANNYSIGVEKRTSKPKDLIHSSENLELTSTSKEEHNLIMVTQADSLWNTELVEAINLGNVIHELMENIEVEEDVDLAIKRALTLGLIDTTNHQKLNNNLKELIAKLKPEGFFNHEHYILNERDINFRGKTIRPDRLELNNDNEAWLLDYKTGSKSEAHSLQINTYAQALLAMGYKIKKKLIVYLDGEIQLFIP